ncbi:MAG TPA: alkene reductase, partial [Luteimonas sp.]|nr:alkene reductase [Luteimonas sp.]
MYPHLLLPVDAGSIALPNRVLMAPLTRSRAGQPGDVPTALNAAYYAQRAGAGLIVSEATQISRQGQGYAWTPGIHSDAQEAGWKGVTDAVHAQGGRIAAQLWHVGRISHPLLQPGGAAPVAPSALVAEGAKCFVVKPDGTAGNVPTALPRALETGEIAGIVADYAHAAQRADRAGFDLVEVHAANGYLLHQFLSTNSNTRIDAYGGSLDNRARITLEVIDAVVAVLGAGRVGVRLSPHFTAHGIADDEAEASALHLAREFSRRGIAYLHIAEPDWVGGPKLSDAFR